MTENREQNTASSRYKKQIRIVVITVLIINLIVVGGALYKYATGTH
jgi:flagellar basal body-associated protein FliL